MSFETRGAEGTAVLGQGLPAALLSLNKNKVPLTLNENTFPRVLTFILFFCIFKFKWMYEWIAQN